MLPAPPPSATPRYGIFGLIPGIAGKQFPQEPRHPAPVAILHVFQPAYDVAYAHGRLAFGIHHQKRLLLDHGIVHQIIVVRGPDAMAPRDPLPLRLPEAAPEEAAPEGDEPVDEEQQDEGSERFGGIDPFERGPEITEVR